MDELISRGELEGMLWAITDIKRDVKRIADAVVEDDDGEEEEDG